VGVTSFSWPDLKDQAPTLCCLLGYVSSVKVQIDDIGGGTDPFPMSALSSPMYYAR